MQAPTEFFKGFRCSDFVWELVPVDGSPGEEGVPVYLTGVSLLVELVSSSVEQSAVCPIPDILACESRSQESLSCSHPSRTRQPSSGFLQGSVCWIGWWDPTLLRHTRGLDG